MTNKVSAIQMVSTANIDENLNTAAGLIAKAVEGGARLVLLPEVFAVLEGGPMRQFGEIEGDPEAQLQNFLSQQASKHQVIIVGGTIPLISRPPKGEVSAAEIIESERVRSACLVFDESGAQIARYDKIHLFDVIVNDEQSEYSESRSYEPGVDIVSVDTSVGNLGLSICYDMRFPELYRALFQRGAELVTVPAAFTKVTGEAHWESLLRARAIENQCYVIAAGQGGRHSQTRETWGHSMIIDPWGTVLAMVEEGEGVATAEINLEFVRNVRARMPIREQQKLG
jgi:predicted amidohydrolase